MEFLRLRCMAAACVTAATLLAVPAESKAFDALDRLLGIGAYSNTYNAPHATYYAPESCATRTCYYVPQASYRTVCLRVPVTTCQAVTACDPCTGCPVTAYRPVTVWTTQTQLVSYTTYRLVYSN